MTLQLWHETPDAVRTPRRVSAGERVALTVGTWPIGPEQSVWVTWQASAGRGRADARWTRNEGENSYWSAVIGPFAEGDDVAYAVWARDCEGEAPPRTCRFRVGPRIHLAILWHQHQPMYRVPQPGAVRPVLSQPWVRLHTLRDYYSMAALVAEQPDVHVTVNLTPVLLEQLDDYVMRGATDRALELTLADAESLGAGQREELLGSFFDADWHRQIFVHHRYRELFEQRTRGAGFSPQDVRDLQMWFNLAWFGTEFRDGPAALVTGETVDVHRFVQQQAGFSRQDIAAMVGEQYKLLSAVVPLHRRLQDRGQIEVTTTPYFHPILPLVIDTDDATIDLNGASLPDRFAYPEDADTHVRRAVEDYTRRFGRAPEGMWPAEGAVSAAAAAMLAGHGVRWIASDRGVLAKSGRWGYEVDDPDVLCQPYRVAGIDGELGMFFRDTSLSDAIGFRYQHVADPDQAADAFVCEVEERFAGRFQHDEDRIVTVVLDGENAWGGYRDDGRPFLRALYRRLAGSPAIRTVTFSEYLRGNPGQSVRAHPARREVHELFTGSWIDEVRSRPGVDLGTWIGERDENRAWELLGAARRAIDRAPAGRRTRALESALAAEGSDWFWWFGDDQDSGNDEVFDELFRAHLGCIYEAMGVAQPPDLRNPLVTRRLVWTFARPVPEAAPGDWLTIRTNCAGTLVWRMDAQPERAAALEPVGGVLAGARRFQVSLGQIPAGVASVAFRFHCAEETCGHDDVCCRGEPQQIRVVAGSERRAQSFRE